MTEKELTLPDKIFDALLLAGAVCCGIDAASPASAGWCDCGHRPRDGAASPPVRVYIYVDNPQVFRSQLRPEFSYGIEFYCVSRVRGPRGDPGAEGLDAAEPGSREAATAGGSSPDVWMRGCRAGNKLVSLLIPKFAGDVSIEVWRTSESGH